MYILLGTIHEQTTSQSGNFAVRLNCCLFILQRKNTNKKFKLVLFCGNSDNSLQVTGAQVATLKHHKSPVRDCSWHPFNTMLVSSSWDGDVVKWEFAGSGDRPASLTKRAWTRHFYDEYI